MGFEGTARFAVRRRLGAGGMGVVYEAEDRETSSLVALKTLHHVDAQRLYRLKNEFRGLQGLVHPNLVQLGEFFADSGEWFFTMELIDGVDFVTYVRGGPPDEQVSALDDTASFSPPGTHVDDAKLRAALLGLGKGLHALHGAGKVHRDIKPPNVLVTPDGRPVILDFGLMRETASPALSSEDKIVGTAAYMAPEQAAQRPIGPAADWYAVGVMLYQALTGRLPFTGTVFQIVLEKQQSAPPRPSAIDDTVSPDLDELCARLLEPSPDQRLDAPGYFELLGATDGPRRTPESSRPSSRSLFVGRDQQRRILSESLEATRRGAPVAVYIHGPSGIGKTALLREFVRTATRRGAVALQGRCYERESVPFKALDGAIDALSRHLCQLSRVEASARMPRNAGLLPRVFPTLGRVDPIAMAPLPVGLPADPHELRHRAFNALRELLHRIAEHQSLVLLIDDLQWADRDSFVLLEQLLRAPDPPPLLLVVTSRDPLDALAERHGNVLGILSDATALALTPLSSDESHVLASTLLAEAQLGGAIDASQIASEAGGHPLFIDEIVRHAAAAPNGYERVALDDAIWARARALPPQTLWVLQLLCVAGGPLPHLVLRRAGDRDYADYTTDLGLLRVAHLARSRGVRDDDFAEPFHDRVRETVVTHLGDEDKLRAHRLLASAFEATEFARARPELLVPHFLATGASARAAELLSAAGDNAARALAFERAARLYEEALRLGDFAREQRSQVLEALATVQTSEGVLADAAQNFLAAANGASPERAFELQRRALEQMLRAGQLQEGMTLAEHVLQRVDLSLPRGRVRTIARVLRLRAEIKLFARKPRQKSSADPTDLDLRPLDVCWSVASGLAFVDPLLGHSLALEFVKRAFHSGEINRSARAATLMIGFSALGGTRNRIQTERAIAVARRLADEADEPGAVAFSKGADGAANFLCGAFQRAYDLLDGVIPELRAAGPAYRWEVDIAYAITTSAMVYLGRFAELRDLVRAVLGEADARGDKFLAKVLRCWRANMLWLALDQPDVAKQQSEWFTGPGDDHSFRIQDFYRLHGDVQRLLYVGDSRAAWDRLEADWARSRRSLTMRVQSLGGEMSFLRGRAALALASTGDDRSSGRDETTHDKDDSPTPAWLVSEARRCARQLRRERADWLTVFADLLDAAVAHHRGDDEARAAHLDKAMERADGASMRLFAAAARARRAQLAGDNDAVAAAFATMSECGVVAPSKMVELLTPGLQPGA